jgi:hypothetical protein
MDLKIVSCLTAGYSAGFDGLLLQAQKVYICGEYTLSPTQKKEKEHSFYRLSGLN